VPEWRAQEKHNTGKEEEKKFKGSASNSKEENEKKEIAKSDQGQLRGEHYRGHWGGGGQGRGPWG